MICENDCRVPRPGWRSTAKAFSALVPVTVTVSEILCALLFDDALQVVTAFRALSVIGKVAGADRANLGRFVGRMDSGVCHD